ncbi:YkgJ family cysteine cluster protein [Geomesophilobacter sediminis]|uniref:YkgJ family cysteine cluster protein n=1 Tax=Geomesophilobacter sediminis TaxID=2798584 RepID=A0A8J7M318_9BACT|nr:YkgJ family cysteine cluster protein [Geomesophilobacter sediminis]MBJ6727830.1 YkgJ family cysteine cluster protein [Geomesophilobacter sediminis]
MPLQNYLTLLERVDALCARTATQFADHITCRPGCDSCCRHLSISAVEAAALVHALRELPEEQAALVREQAQAADASSPCPLLHDGLCLIYHARPIICRTHGLPLLIRQDGAARVDFCPDNFQGIDRIPGSAVLDLERLNEMLAAINALYLQQCPGPERIHMAQCLRHSG